MAAWMVVLRAAHWVWLKAERWAVQMVALMVGR